MKIMIHSNAPWVPSGYGRQTALAIEQLTGLGHEVAVSAYHGLSGGILQWDGVPVYPGGMAPFGVDVMLQHANHFGAQLLITLMDTWSLMPILDHLAGSLKLPGAPAFAAWTPVDCEPLSQGDRLVLRKTEAVPLAMSDHGVQALQEAGLSGVRYLPHSVNTSVYRPIYDGGLELRQEVGVRPDQFVIGIVAANRDANRKAWPEQMRAFAMHLQSWPDSELWIHTIGNTTNGGGGYDLRTMAYQMGIGHAVRWTDDYRQLAGLVDDEDMALWYNAINLLSACSYGEGFGLPIVEAQACGVPALATDASSMTELATETVGGQRWWNAIHDAWWLRPDTNQIFKAYNRFREAHRDGTLERPEIHAGRVARFEVDYVAQAHWKPFLEAVEAAR